MNTIFKTLILAATGAALIAVSPASAQTHTEAQKRVQRTTVPMMLNVPPSALWTYGEINPNTRVDPYAQIRDEYLKDSPTHNGNSY
ncbi:MAG TPA: hypothetical protein VM867_14050 [Xanthobacteraceae bacterium]|jgi:hypothetical protein|nr:hypothetical protein [Xanthobacteraceae bacterium]